MTAALFVLSVVVAGLVAAVLHELTHWTVAVLGGREAWIEWRALNERHVIPTTGPNLVDLAVGVSPFVIGAVAAVAYLFAGGELTVPRIVGWGVYTLNGIPNDFRITPTLFEDTADLPR